MPRGYLKHEKGVNHKQSRGGSSFRSRRHQSPERHSKLRRCRDVSEEDFSISTPRYRARNGVGPKSASEYVGECGICFEIRPLFKLSQKCEWHGAACRKCLRRIYVEDAQKSVDNYPLRCFHPACNQHMQTSQLQKYNILLPEEFKKHQEMILLSRNLTRIKSNGLRTVACSSCQSPYGVSKKMMHDKNIHCYMCKEKFVVRPDYASMGLLTVICPTCETSRGIPEVPKNDERVQCKSCKFNYCITPDYPTIRALESLTSDKFGHNYGWARCPSCGILISKGNGCYHMVCGCCKHDFDWDQALGLKELVGRPPDSEIHLWW